MTLLESGIKGLKWASFARVFKQLVQFITVLILANLLEPKDFGLMGMALILINFLNSFRDFGFGSALIQKKDVSERLLSNVFIINLLLTIFLFLIVFFSADFIAVLLSNVGDPSENLAVILKILSFGLLISGISSIQQAMLEKKIKFDLIAKLEVAGSLGGAFTGIYLAFQGFGVWSLVFQYIGVIAIVSIGILLNSGFPKFKSINLGELYSVYKYSINLSGYNLANYFVRNADYLLIGKILGNEALGYYSLAYRIMLYPIQNITNVVSKVLLPVYSKIQADYYKFRDMYKDVTFVIAFITVPMMVGIFILSKDFTYLFLNPKWEIVGDLLLILTPIGALQSMTTTTGSIYQAVGRTDIMLKWGFYSGIIIVISFIIGLNWGVVGVAYSYLTINLVLFIPWLKIPFKIIGLNILDFINHLKSIFYSSLIMFLILKLINYTAIFNELIILKFILQIFLGVTVYIACSILINKKQLTKIYNRISLKGL